MVVAGCLLPWYALGGETGELTPLVLRAFDGSGILAFLAAFATLAVVALPYAVGDRPVGIDRALTYALLAVTALAGIVLWLPDKIDVLEGLLPPVAPGWWLSAAGTMILARAAFDVAQERGH